jgi:hypothetical protein
MPDMSWMAPEQPPPQKPKVQDPGFWETILNNVKDIPDDLLKKLKDWASAKTSKPVQGMKGEPTAEMVNAMGPLARRRQLLNSYNQDDADIRR